MPPAIMCVMEQQVFFFLHISHRHTSLTRDTKSMHLSIICLNSQRIARDFFVFYGTDDKIRSVLVPRC